MASTGAVAWAKYYQGKDAVDTVMKADSTLYDESGRSIGTVKAGDPVTVLAQAEFTARYPIQTMDGTVGYVTFNNIQKPRTSRTMGIKLKPQDFACIKAKPTWIAKDLATALISEIDDRTDLEPQLKNYLMALTEYWAGLNNMTEEKVGSLYTQGMSGLAEIQKDYGEMLGAIACVSKGILAGKAPRVTSSAIIDFPIRGNEPIVDYYIKTTEDKISISAKSGETTNTLKPGDIINLLDSVKTARWKNTVTYKMMQLVAEKSTAILPYHAINLLYPGTLSGAALKAAETDFKTAYFSNKVKSPAPYANLFKMVGFKVTDPPTIGNLFYATEKLVVQTMNEKYLTEAGKIFDDATAGLVIYVKYKITSGSRAGTFEVMSSDAMTVKKKDVKWRSKNASTRAADKIGLQP